MIDLVTLVVFSLAAYRLGNLLSWEAGPYDMFGRLRYLLGVRYDELSKPVPKTEVARMILCVYCNTVWIAFAICVLYYIIGSVVVYVCFPLAISGAAVAINEMVSNG